MIINSYGIKMNDIEKAEKDTTERLIALEVSLIDLKVFLDEKFMSIINLITSHKKLQEFHSEQIYKINERCSMQKLDCVEKYEKNELNKFKFLNSRMFQILLIVCSGCIGYILKTIIDIKK